jgi:ankyrin repeat protein
MAILDDARIVARITQLEDDNKHSLLFYAINKVTPYKSLDDILSEIEKYSFKNGAYNDMDGNMYDPLGSMLNYDLARVHMHNLMKWLLANGANANQLDLIGNTPLLTAITMIQDPVECEDVCRILLEGGADPNLCGKYTMSPLLTAVVKGSVAVARMLVEHGANVNTEYQTDSLLLIEPGETALGYAARTGHREMTMYLVKTRKNRLQNLLRALAKVDNRIRDEILELFEYIPSSQLVNA